MSSESKSQKQQSSKAHKGGAAAPKPSQSKANPVTAQPKPSQSAQFDAFDAQTRQSESKQPAKLASEVKEMGVHQTAPESNLNRHPAAIGPSSAMVDPSLPHPALPVPVPVPASSSGVGFKVLSFGPKPSKIKLMLKEDNIFHILSFLDGYSLARFCCVCVDWAKWEHDASIWKEMCLQLWRESTAMKYVAAFEGNWKRLFVEVNHVRYDGVYMLEVLSWRLGGYGLAQHQQVIKHAYYRLYRFFPNNVVHYALLTTLNNAERHFASENNDKIKKGHYRTRQNGVECLVDCGHLTCKMTFEFHPTYTGGNNRISMVEFVGRENNGVRDIIRFKLPNSSAWFHSLNFNSSGPSSLVPNSHIHEGKFYDDDE